MKFVDFPPCKNRFGCVECRNNSNFQKHMKERFGDWDCPEGIALNTPLGKMPESIQKTINEYVSRMQKKGQDIPIYTDNSSKDLGEIAEQDRIEKMRKPRSFTDTAQCRFRSVCVDCRNNEKFREKIKERFGDWDCPEGIALNTPLNKMPKRTKDNHERKNNQKIVQQKRIENVKESIDAIEELLPDSALYLIDRIRYFVFPHEKAPSLCINKGASVTINEACCGGKTKESSGFICKVHGEVANTKCGSCKHFERER